MRYFFLLLIIISLSAEAQKRRKSRDLSDMMVTELSETDSLKAEITLIEAEKQLILENFDKALELFEVAASLNPSNPALYFKIAETKAKLDDHEGAIPIAEEALKMDPNNKYYHLLLGELYKSISRFNKAAGVYENMIKEVSGTESYLFDLAIIYRYLGRNDDAIATYNQVEDFYGPSEALFREKEQIYLQQKKYDAIISELDKLIDVFPDNTNFQIQYFQFLITQQEFDKAIQELQRIEGTNAYEAIADYTNLLVLLTNRELDEALNLAEVPLSSPYFDSKLKLQLINDLLSQALTTEAFDEIGNLCKGLAEKYKSDYMVQAFSGDILYRLEQVSEARDYYLRAVEIDPGKFEVWQNILNIDANLGDNTVLIKHAEEALEYFPNQALLYYFAGTGYLLKRNYNRAIQLLEQGAKFAVEPSLKSIMYGQLGDAYNGLKDHENSDKSYQEALQSDPNNDHVLNNYSYFLSLREDNLTAALEMSTQLIELHPDNPTYLDTHGWVLYKLKRYKDAEPILEKAASLDEDGTVIEHYGDVLFQLGLVDEALQQWQKASTLGDASENIEKKIADKKLYEQ